MEEQYVNFDKTSKCNPKIIYHPSNVSDIIRIIKRNNAASYNITDEESPNFFTSKNKKLNVSGIRVVGSHHTFNDISMTPDTLIKMDKLTKILKVNVPKNKVTVEAGIIVYDLCEQLAKYNLALPVVPAISRQSIVGAISTGTHGSRTSWGSMASMVESVYIVTENGDFIKFKKDHPFFNALTVSLGSMGCVYAVTLKCEPLFGIKMKTIDMSWDNFLKERYEILSKREFCHVYLNLFDASCKVMVAKKVKINENQSNIYYKYLTSPDTELYTETEMSMNYRDLEKAVNDIMKFVKKHPDNKFINKDALVRFSGRDRNAFISMTANRELNVHISMFGDVPVKEQTLKLFEDYQNLVVEKYNARPHYGKHHTLDKMKMMKIYPDLEKFLEVRESMDPNEMFSNSYVKRILDS